MRSVPLGTPVLEIERAADAFDLDVNFMKAVAKIESDFNPKAVAAYRLIGHEANSLADLTPAAVEAELAAGESATAMVELWFQPAEIDDLGRAELSWHDAGGELRRVSQRISRLQFAPTFAEAADCCRKTRYSPFGTLPKDMARKASVTTSSTAGPIDSTQEASIIPCAR